MVFCFLFAILTAVIRLIKKDMEYNNDSIQVNEPVILKEKKSSSHNLWYLILILLLLGLLGWFAYIKGWFGSKTTVPGNQVFPVEPNGGIGDGAESLDNLLQSNAPVDSIVINSLESFPVQKTLRVTGNLPDGCTYLNDPQVIRSGNAFYVNLTTRREGETCTQALVPYERNIALDVVGLPAGVYTVSINGKTTQFELEQDNKIDFSAGSEK